MKSKIAERFVKPALAALAFASLAASAQGLLPPPRPIPPMPWRPVPWIDTIPKETNEKDCTVGALEVKALVRGLYARVETTITIKNPNPRPISAPLRIPLPDGGAVCGYRLEIDGTMVPSVAVPKEQARVAFETEQRRGVDPGLAEAVKGNVFQTRVYPVPANGSRKIRVDYVAPLVLSGGDSAALSLPMPDVALESRKIDISVEDGAGAPELGGLGDKRFEHAARVWTVSSSETNLTPRADVLVALPKLPDTVEMTEHWNGELFRLVSKKTKGAEEITAGENPFVIWDASASRLGDHEKEFEILRSLVKGKVSLLLLRNALEPELKFAGAEELISFLKTIDYDGGTKIAPNLRDFTALFAEPKILFFTDGMDTLSLSPCNSSDNFKEGRITAFVSGAERDVFALECLCGRVVDVRVWPNLPARTVEVYRTESTMGGFPPEMPVLSVAWAIKRAEQLSGSSVEHKDELMELGRRFGVASKACSLLVLESLDQWIRYDIEPPKELAKMHADWLEGRKGRMELTPEGKAERHLYALVDYWNERKAWHQRDFKKDPNRKSRPVEAEEEVGFLRSAGFSLGATNGSERRRAVAAAEMDDDMPMPEACAMAVDDEVMAERSLAESKSARPGRQGAAAKIQVKAWSPDTPWMKALDAAGDVEAAKKAYLALRKEWAKSPAFILDSAGWFYAHGDKAFAERVISNLAELRIEDAALLRVMAWRLSEGGSRALEVDTLRRVLALRPEDPQSHRDLALALDRWARETVAVDPGWAAMYAEEALKHYGKTILTPWQRHAVEFSSIALEERNAFVAWIKTQDWRGSTVKIPELDDRLSGVLDCDMRVVMAWDADETDVDIHVTEPDGEEAYYANRLTFHGGRTSMDITDGYGPEEYEIRVAPKGKYKVRAHYYASHQQAVFGPATVTATIFTNWGRSDQKSERLSIRLDKKKEMVDLGEVELGL
ncbi:MAG: DUF2135 domain-containing protein [Kiritimatiellae bacterium]|nr:DUF2135 domain-containing protein [Kiritimatiellia bacterium]